MRLIARVFGCLFVWLVVCPRVCLFGELFVCVSVHVLVSLSVYLVSCGAASLVAC